MFSVLLCFRLKRRALGWICLGIVASFALAGFWPFDFRTPNNVRRLADGSGLQFERHGHALSREPLVIDPGWNPGAPAAFSIEFLVETDSEPDRESPILIALYDGQLPESIVVGQWKSGVLLRASTADPAARRHYWEVGASTVLRKGQRVLVAIVSDGAGTAIYKDGQLVRRQPRRIARHEILHGSLILGNSATGSGGTWKGKMYGLAFLDRALGPAEALERHGLWFGPAKENLALAPGTAGIYFFDDRSGESFRDHAGKGPDIVIPEQFRVPRKMVLAFSKEDFEPDFSRLEDIVVNVGGFIPFGLFFFLYLRQSWTVGRAWHFVAAMAAGSALSLSIELIQVYLPSRSSSLTDVMSNVIGTLLGILVTQIGRKTVRD